MINKTKKDESGFVILVAIGVLMGMLAIITSLVRFDQDNKASKSHRNIDVTVQSMKSALKKMSRHDSFRSSSENKTKLMKNWNLPHFKSLPIILTLANDFNNGDASIEIQDMRKVFFNLATSRVRNTADDQFPVIRLQSDLAIDGTSFTLEYDDGTSVNVVDILDYENGTFVAVGNELIAVNPTTSPSPLTAVNRGYYGGGRSAHKAGEIAHIMPVDPVSGVVSGVVRLQNIWYEVEIEQMFHSSARTPSFSIVEKLSEGDHPVPSSGSHVLAASTLEFYPFDPGFHAYEDNWDLNFSYLIEDEAGKLNLNTLPYWYFFDAFNGMFGVTEGSYSTVVTEYMPFQFNEELVLKNGDSVENLTQFLNNMGHNLTVFNKPNYTTGFDSFVFQVDNSITDTNLYRYQQDSAGVAVRTTNTGTETEYPILPHAINVNTASTNVLTNFFEDLDGITNPQQIARAIVCYRSALNFSGALPSSFSNEHLDEEYNDSYNPFDGTNDYPLNDGVRATGGTIEIFGSAAEEFYDFLELLSLTADQRKLIMAYTLKDVDAIDELLVGSYETAKNLLTFEASDVKRAHFNMSVSVDGSIISEVTETEVYEDYPVYDEYGEKIHLSASNEGTIYLNSQNGWNEPMSLFNGVSTGYSTVRTLTAGGSYEFDATDSRYNNASVYPYLNSYASNVLIGGPGQISAGGEHSFFYSSDVSTLINNTGIDFGMRIKGENFYDSASAVPNVFVSGDNVAIDSGDFTGVAGFNVATLNNYATTGALVMHVAEIDDSYAISSVVTVGANVVMTFTDDLGFTPILYANSDVVFTTGPDEEFYNFTNRVGTSPAGTAAFYETVLHVPNANFNYLSIEDRYNLNSGQYSVTVQELELGSNTVLNTLNNNAFPRDMALSSPTSGFVRLRFTFDGDFTGTSANTLSFPTPQLYEARVTYQITDVPQKRKVLYKE